MDMPGVSKILVSNVNINKQSTRNSSRESDDGLPNIDHITHIVLIGL